MPRSVVSKQIKGVSMYEYLRNVNRFRRDLKNAMPFALNTARYTYYLPASQMSIVRPDLKSKNVLLSKKNSVDGTPRAVMCELGLCEVFGEGFENAGSGKMAMKTASCASPGVISGRGYEARDDLYSCGVLGHASQTACRTKESTRCSYCTDS